MDENIIGYCLGVVDYEGNDQIISFLCQEYGLLKVKAKGSKNIKSKNRVAVQPFCLSEFSFTYFRPEGLSILKSATLINSHYKITNNLLSLGIASFLCEYAEKTLGMQNENYEYLFQLVEELFKNDVDLLFYLYLEVKILINSGFDLIVDCCSKCGTTKNIVGVSISDGGFICSECVNESSIYLDRDSLLLMRYLVKYNIDQIRQIKIEQSTIKALYMPLEMFFKEYISVYVKSQAFIKTIYDL